jgi:hypothetical protein
MKMDWGRIKATKKGCGHSKRKLDFRARTPETNMETKNNPVGCSGDRKNGTKNKVGTRYVLCVTCVSMLICLLVSTEEVGQVV